MDLTDRQRDLLKALGYVVPGNVYKVHHKILGFGHEDSPWHFTTNISEYLENIEAVTVIPVSTKRYNKNIVPLNLSKDSNLKQAEGEILDLESYAIIGIPKQIRIQQFFAQPTTHFRGALHQPKREEVLAARKKYLQIQFNKRGGK